MDPDEPERVIRAVDLGTSRWLGVHWGVGDSILTTVEVDVGHPPQRSHDQSGCALDAASTPLCCNVGASAAAMYERGLRASLLCLAFRPAASVRTTERAAV